MPEKKDEQGQLFRRQVQGPSSSFGPLRCDVDMHVAIRKRQILGRAPTTDQGAVRARSSSKANGLQR